MVFLEVTAVLFVLGLIDYLAVLELQQVMMVKLLLVVRLVIQLVIEVTVVIGVRCFQLVP